MALCCVLAGCQVRPSPSPEPVFPELYSQVAHRLPSSQVDRPDEQLLTLSTRDMPLVEFLRWVADNGGVSVVADLSLDDKSVSVEVESVPVSQLLAAVARRLNVTLTRTGTVYYLGQARPEDRGILARKVSRLSAEELGQAISVLLTSNGRVTALSDGLVLVGDTLEVLERINAMLDEIERAPLDSWVVQMLVVSITESAAHHLGLDLTPTLELSAALSNAANIPTGLDITAGLEGLLRATRTTAGASVEARPLFVLVDGSTSRHSNADTIPIPKKAVVEGAGIQTTEFEFVEVGFVVEVGIREVGEGRALLDVDVDLQQVVGFVESAPIARGQTFQTRAVIESGGVYLLGEMNTTNRRQTIDGPFQLAEVQDDDNTTIQVWLRSYRIAGPAQQQEPKGGAGNPGGVPLRGGGREAPPRPGDEVLAMNGGDLPEPDLLHRDMHEVLDPVILANVEKAGRQKREP